MALKQRAARRRFPLQSHLLHRASNATAACAIPTTLRITALGKESASAAVATWPKWAFHRRKASNRPQRRNNELAYKLAEAETPALASAHLRARHNRGPHDQKLDRRAYRSGPRDSDHSAFSAPHTLDQRRRCILSLRRFCF